MPKHTHIQNSHSHTIGSAYAASSGNSALTSSNGFNFDSGENISGSGGYYPKTDGGNYMKGESTYHSHTCSSTTAVNQNTGGDAEHNNMQPYIVLNYIIKYE